MKSFILPNMTDEITRRTVALDYEAEKALERIRNRDKVRSRKPSVSAVVRKALVKEAGTK